MHDGHLGSDERNTENTELSLSEILPVNLVDRLYLSVAVTGDKYCIFARVQRPYKINCYMWKICHGEPRSFTNWPAEFGKICRGKLWSLMIRVPALVPVWVIHSSTSGTFAVTRTGINTCKSVTIKYLVVKTAK